MAVVSELQRIITSEVEGLGYDFVGMDYSPGKVGPSIRVYADLIGGVTISDCEQISKHLTTVLTVELEDMEFTLEVSSPGLDRKLFTVGQCEQHIGSKVKVVLQTAIEGRRKFIGVLSNVENTMLSIDTDGQVVTVDYVNVKEIRLSPDIKVGKRV